MKRKYHSYKIEKSASQIKAERLRALIVACRERFTDGDIIEMFTNVTGTDYVEYKSAEDTIFDLSTQGYCIFKPDSLSKAEQLKEYAETNIFPYYNEQQTCILY